MNVVDYSSMFFCPKCGLKGTILFAKISGKVIVLKIKCPKHGVTVSKPPLMALSQMYDLIRDGTYRCLKCGQEALGSWVKSEGPWTKLKCTCPVHGKQGLQQIWNAIYNEISNRPASAKSSAPAPSYATPSYATPQPAAPPPAEMIIPQATPELDSEDEPRYCPQCGTELRDAKMKFCNICGTKLED